MDITEYKKLLKEYISLKSVSTDPEMKGGIDATAAWLVNFFKINGFESYTLDKQGLNPVVFASIEIDPKFETVLIYGHYDVQPASKEDGWDFEPFDLVEKNGKLIGRGVVDNKGQNLIHIFSVINLLNEGNLKYNVKFFIEGDEETGGVELIGEILEEKKELLKSDYFMVSDGEMVAGKPCIESSFRGGFNLTLKYETAKNNVHSGLYGGAVPNAAFELSTFVSKLYSTNNMVTVPDFYNGVDEISTESLESNSILANIGQQEALDNAGFKALKTEENKYDFFTQTGLRPTLQVTGFKSGYIGNGYSNIVPAQAEVRINFRLVASQKPEDIIEIFKKFVAQNTPDYVTYTIEVGGVHNPIKLDTKSAIFEYAKKLLKEVYNDEVFDYNVGGAIPFIAKIKELFNIDTLSVGLCNEDCNMHGANENFKIDLIEKGLNFSRRFFSKS